jgi:hypothetical protein
MTKTTSMANKEATLKAKGSVTTISEFAGHFYWTIENWKSWIACSEKDATLSSGKFDVHIVNEKGEPEATTWMIKAFTKKHASGKDTLAFRLVSLNSQTPKGTFQFRTVHRTKLWGGFGEATVSKFKPLPLDAANHWMTCIRYHTSNSLTVKVNLKIVSAQTVSACETPKSLHSVAAGDNGNVASSNKQKAKKWWERLTSERRGSSTLPLTFYPLGFPLMGGGLFRPL